MQTACGFNDSAGVKGADLLVALGPTLFVNIGFDPKFQGPKGIPTPGISNVEALVDTGAGESCIDNILASTLKLPIVDRQPIAGSNGKHTTNIYRAQIHVPSLKFTIIGRFAGVDLIAGGQQHKALIGRTFLRRFKMIYDGGSGTVIISS